MNDIAPYLLITGSVVAGFVWGKISCRLPIPFTDAVFVPEGLHPTVADRHLYRQVRDLVREAFDRAQDGCGDAD